MRLMDTFRPAKQVIFLRSPKEMRQFLLTYCSDENKGPEEFLIGTFEEFFVAIDIESEREGIEPHVSSSFPRSSRIAVSEPGTDNDHFLHQSHFA